ncbi:MAG: hypothetical protein RIQ82_1231 [Bacteroidota bacterium]
MRGVPAPHLQDFLSQINELIAIAKAEGIKPSPQMARARLEGLSAFVSFVPDIAFSESRRLRINSCDIPVAVYSPRPSQKLPVVLYFHGGGHMCGGVDLYDPMCRKLALAGNCVVISVDYKLAPEFPYPNGLRDAQHVLENFDKVLTGVEFENTIILAGDSAGGAMCSTLTSWSISAIETPIHAQILIYPSVDYTMGLPSVEENGEGYFLEKTRIQWYFDNYFANGENAKDVSPLYMPLPKNGPDTLVITAGCDPLKDEGQKYAERCSAQGFHTEHYCFENMIHAFMNIEDLCPQECQTLYARIGDFIQSVQTRKKLNY